MIGRHLPDRGPRQYALAVELASVRQHLKEARVVDGDARRAGAAGVVLRRDRDVVERDGLARRLVDGQRLRQTLDLVGGHEERRVGHPERPEQAGFEKAAERHAADRFDDAARDVGRQTVLPLLRHTSGFVYPSTPNAYLKDLYTKENVNW